MKRFKRLMILLILLIVAFNVSTIFGKQPSVQWHQEWSHTFTEKMIPKKYSIDPLPHLETKAEAAILMDALTGDILFEKNSRNSLAIASMSKIMTELLVLEALDVGKIEWEDIVPISDYAFAISSQPGYASVHLKQDKAYTVRELFHAMAIRSANGATIALAEMVSGSEQEFVALMNEKAQQLGLNDTYFVNSTGLTNKDLLGYHTTGSLNDNNRMSAIGLATLTKYVIRQFPELLEITRSKELEFYEQTYVNSNWMLQGIHTDTTAENLMFPGVDGLKTGYTDDAGYCFTGTTLIDDRRFISVIIGTPEMVDRFLETKMLYEAVAQQMNNTDIGIVGELVD